MSTITVDFDCEATRLGARCVMEREDEMTRRVGLNYTATVEAAIENDTIVGILSWAIDEQRDQLMGDYFWRYHDHHIDEAISACPWDNLGQRCGHLEYLDDFPASRGR